MDFIQSSILNAIYILFPLLLYMIYVAYCNNLNKKEQSITLELALFTSLYLLMKYGLVMEDYCMALFFNIPLLVSYLKNKYLTSVLISGILIFHYVSILKLNFYFIFFEYIIYFVIFVILRKKKLTFNYLINIFVLIKGFLSSIFMYNIFSPEISFWANFVRIFIFITAFYVVSYLIFYILQKGEEIMDLNSTLKELEKEKTLRNSLFKITHEIKNPIAVCKGYLDMLDLNNEKKVKKYIPIVKEEISRTLVLMDDFLDYTKIKVEREEIDIIMLLEDTRNSLESLFRSNNIKTYFDIPEEELYIMGDYNRLKQVLVNILKNALEAKDESKEMKIHLSVTADHNKLNIIVEDNGIGMNEETLKRVGEMFFTTKKRGTGLGATLSKEIIELHNGSIKYHSKLNEGTKVYINLPLCTD